MSRDAHGYGCKEDDLVNTGSLGKRSDSTIQFYPGFLAAGHVLAFPFHLLHGLMLARCLHKLVTISSHQRGVAQRIKLIFGYPCFASVGNPAELCHITNLLPLERFGY